MYQLDDVQPLFQAIPSIIQASKPSEEKQELNPIPLDISQHVKTETYSVVFPVDSFKDVFQALQKKNCIKLGDHVGKMKSWDDIDAVFLAIETLKPTEPVWNANIAERGVVNAAPRVLDGFVAQQEALKSTRSVKLKAALHKSSAIMKEKLNVLIKDIRAKGDDCNPNVILPQSQYGSDMNKNFEINWDRNEVKLRGGQKEVNLVKRAIIWLQNELLTEILWNLKKQFDSIHDALFFNPKIVVHEDLFQILMALMRRYEDHSSIAGFVSLPLVWIKLTSGKQAMQLTVKLLTKFRHMYGTSDSIKILMSLCESSIASGDNFPHLQKLILGYSRLIMMGIARKNHKGEYNPEHWHWMQSMLGWLFDVYGPARDVADTTKIVLHLTDLHEYLDLFSKAWFATQILQFLWKNKKGDVPQTFINFIENDLDIHDWKYGQIMDV